MGSFILRMGTCHIDGELEGGSLKVFGNATRGGDITDMVRHLVKSTSGTRLYLIKMPLGVV